MLEGVIPTDTISVKGNVKITLWNKQNTIVINDHNAIQSNGYNYLKDALITSGTFDPIANMVMAHSGGNSTKPVNISDLGIKECKFDAVWGVGEAFTSVSSFSLISSTLTYSILSVAPFSKSNTYSMTVEWTIFFS